MSGLDALHDMVHILSFCWAKSITRNDVHTIGIYAEDRQGTVHQRSVEMGCAEELTGC